MTLEEFDNMLNEYYILIANNLYDKRATIVKNLYIKYEKTRNNTKTKS